MIVVSLCHPAIPAPLTVRRHRRTVTFIPCWARGRRPGRVQGSTVQSSTVQGSTVQGSTVQGSTVQGSTVQGSRFKVQAFKGPLSSRLPCSKVVTGCNSVVSVISCEFSGIMGSSFLSIKKSKPGHGRSRRPFRGWLSGRLWKGGQPGPALQRRWRFCRNGLANG